MGFIFLWFFVATVQRPQINLVGTVYNFTMGVSFPAIPLLITPSLPDTVRIEVNDEGYVITGVFGEEGVYSYLITVKNRCGSDNVKLRITVTCKSE